MRSVEPQVFLIARPDVDYEAMAAYLRDVGGAAWLEKFDRGELDDELNDAQNLAEFAGRLCYRSWEPGLNPNVSRVRTDQTDYLQNILASLHGSVLEHVSFSFALHNVSRVMCYDADTDVLTSDGWVPWPKVDGDEEFATVNPATGELEYQHATRRFVSDYDGAMYAVRSEQVELLVTPHHRMWVRPHDTRAGEREQPYLIRPAEHLAGRPVHYLKTVGWTGQSDGVVELPATGPARVRPDSGRSASPRYPLGTFPLRPFARFLGWWLGAGSLDGRRILVSADGAGAADRLVDTIRDMGLAANGPAAGEGCVRTQDVALHEFLDRRCGGPAGERRVPAIVHSWAPAVIREFLDAVVDTAGSRGEDGADAVVCTASPEVADDLQVLAMKAGWSADIRVDHRAGSVTATRAEGQTFCRTGPGSVVSFVRERTQPLVNHGGHRHDGFVHYRGKIYCVEVPNGLLVVRRNGKPVVSGNTHEIVRHRPGVAISQESLRFVRLDEIPFWFPEWAREDKELMKRATALLEELEAFQLWMAGHFGLDQQGVNFAEKKHRTSFMRRFAPEGVATGLVWTANVRTLRHTIEARTAQGAEEEIRLVFHRIGELMREEAPALFGDYVVEDRAWVPRWRKV